MTAKKTKTTRDYAHRLLMLTPQGRTVAHHLIDTGTITQREAIMDHSVQSLTRRITELRDAGFAILADWKKHPITNQRYMRYSLVG
jgi:hypothetical protein